MKPNKSQKDAGELKNLHLAVLAANSYLNSMKWQTFFELNSSLCSIRESVAIETLRP
jgi:hypothetical protein